MRTSILIPAYNAARVIGGVIGRIPPAIVDEVIVVDDGSSDGTSEVLASLPEITVIRHRSNQGYGGAQKTLYQAALDRGSDVMVLMHADGGHFPEELPYLLTPISANDADVVIGDRILGLLQEAHPILGSRRVGAALYGPMPGIRLVGQLGLAAVQNCMFKTSYMTWHSGYRAITRHGLERLPWRTFRTSYLFDTELLLGAHLAGLRVREVPVHSFLRWSGRFIGAALFVRATGPQVHPHAPSGDVARGATHARASGLNVCVGRMG